MSRILKYGEALLALALVIEVSAIHSHGSLWVAFGVFTAMIVLASADLAWGAVHRRVLTPLLAGLIVLLSGFMLAATFEFKHAALTWLIATAAASIEACSLTAVGLPRLRVSALAEPDTQPTTRDERASAEHRVAA